MIELLGRQRHSMAQLQAEVNRFEKSGTRPYKVPTEDGRSSLYG